MADNVPAPAQGGNSSGLVSDLLGLGSLGEKLLDLLSGTVEGLAKPWQTRRVATATSEAAAQDIVRMAKANAEVALVNADLQEELERKALARLRARELRRQTNIEATLAQAANHLQRLEGVRDAEARDVEDDWMQAFLRYAEDVSSEDVRLLWARVLSDQLQARRPPVSLATLDSLRLMEPRLAKALNRVLDLWMAFGQCMDQSNEAYLPCAFTVFMEEHLVLQSIGLLEIQSRLDNYIAFHGFGFIFRNRDGVAENIHVTRLEPSWRGKELARVIRPVDFEHVETAGAPEASSSLGDWCDERRRAGTLAEWAQTLSTLCGEVRLVGKVSSSEDPSGRVTVQNIETHKWVGHWEELPNMSQEVIALAKYPLWVLSASSE